MTTAERLYHWNDWYDHLPEDWRFQVILWPLILIGAINMVLTIAMGFPFALLVVLAMLGLAVIRAPYVLGWIVPNATASSGAPAGAWRLQIKNADWLVDLNRRYDALPEFRGLVLVTVILVAVGAINMLLTIQNGFPFGLLFLLAILILSALRGPYVAGVFGAPEHADAPGAAVRYDAGAGHLPAPTIVPDRVAMPPIDAPEPVSRAGYDAGTPAASWPAADGAAPTHAPGADDHRGAVDDPARPHDEPHDT